MLVFVACSVYLIFLSHKAIAVLGMNSETEKVDLAGYPISYDLHELPILALAGRNQTLLQR